MKNKRKFLEYRAMHEHRNVGDGTCEPLEIRTERAKCNLLNVICGLYVCGQPSRTCKYVVMDGLESMCGRYKR